MSTAKPAGWYPDPEGENRRRYWDGDSWADYYEPTLPETPEVHDATTALQDYPYLAQQGSGSTGGPAAPGFPGLTNSWGKTPTAPTAPPAAPGTRSFGYTKRTNTPMLAVTAAVVLALLVGGYLIFRDPGGPTPGGPTASASPTQAGPTTAATLDTGGATSVEVPAGGAWAGEFTLDSPAALSFEVHDAGDADLDAVVLDASDAVVAQNRDRKELVDVLGGTSLNPFVVADLPAGTYRLVLDEAQGKDATAQVTTKTLDAPIAVGDTIEARPSDADPFVRVLRVEKDQKLTVDVDDRNVSDPILFVRGPDGSRMMFNDNRDYAAGDGRPLLTAEFTPGSWLILVGNRSSVDLTVAVTQG